MRNVTFTRVFSAADGAEGAAVVPATTTTKKAASKGGKKTAKKKAAPKKKAAKGGKGKATKGEPGDISGNQKLILETLARNSQPQTRGQLSEKTGIKKGFSKLLGASTKGEAAPASLEGRGFVVAQDIEGVRGLSYKITAAGKKAIGK